MNKSRLAAHLRHGVVFALEVGSAFALLFFVFLIASIIMVQGDGSAPGVTQLSAAIIDFTFKLLGVSSQGSLFAVVFFWSLPVFLVALFSHLVFHKWPAAQQRKSK